MLIVNLLTTVQVKWSYTCNKSYKSRNILEMSNCPFVEKDLYTTELNIFSLVIRGWLLEVKVYVSGWKKIAIYFFIFSWFFLILTVKMPSYTDPAVPIFVCCWWHQVIESTQENKKKRRGTKAIHFIQPANTWISCRTL